jgi:diguanylate cyclase (GGDEF)-like protein
LQQSSTILAVSAIVRRCAAGVLRGALALALLGGLAMAAAAGVALPLQQQIEELEHEGVARPKQAAEGLADLLPSTPGTSPERLELLTVRGMLLANAQEPEAAEAVAQQLDDWGRSQNAPAAFAAASLVRACAVSQRGNLKRADALISEALSRLPAGASVLARFRFLHTQALIKGDTGKLEDAIRIEHSALALADQIGSPWRQADVRSALAYLYHQARQPERAASLNAEARVFAAGAQDFVSLARVHANEAFLLDDKGDIPGELREMQTAIDYARRAGAKAFESLYLANLADVYLKKGEFKTALVLSEQALPLTRELKDVSGETVALANIGLAHISLKNFELGTRYVRESIAIDEKRGAMASVAASYKELGMYLEKAGEPVGAAKAYHRYRQLDDDIMQRDQQKAIVEMQERFDAERRTRDLALLNRENELKSQELRRRDLQQRLWWLLAATFVLSFSVVVLLVRRVRRTNQALESSNEQLLAQSERDPLTGLANRRHFQAAVGQLASGGKLTGTVFLIDIDHFKRINDKHGHAAGDSVLVEMARRLRETLREQDLIVRWGGEEFLVVVRTLAPDQVEALASRMLYAMAAAPVRHEGHAIAATGSIGFATFPIEPSQLEVSWERAINLVDTAMYLAKAHGRNRAYGVQLLHAKDEMRLDDITRGLEAAWRDGQVALTLLQGPVPLEAAA